MDACMRYDVGRFYQISTDEVYGDLPFYNPDMLFTEESPIVFTHKLGMNKKRQLGDIIISLK